MGGRESGEVHVGHRRIGYTVASSCSFRSCRPPFIAHLLLSDNTGAGSADLRYSNLSEIDGSPDEISVPKIYRSVLHSGRPAAACGDTELANILRPTAKYVLRERRDISTAPTAAATLIISGVERAPDCRSKRPRRINSALGIHTLLPDGSHCPSAAQCR